MDEITVSPTGETLADVIATPPADGTPLIHGLLNLGRKLAIIAGSKAGKSILVMALCLAIAAGTAWIGFPCIVANVLYVNLELDADTCRRRFLALRSAYGGNSGGDSRLHILHLRGSLFTIDQLVDYLLHHFHDANLGLIVIDPIYKIFGGDENSASDAAQFCAQLDRLTAALGCSVAYVHHHPKGSQPASAANRGAGSSVLGRDFDACVDLTEAKSALDHEDYSRQIIKDAFTAWLQKHPWIDPNLSPDTVESILSPIEARSLAAAMDDAKQRIDAVSYSMATFVAREFRTPADRLLRYDYPMHTVVSKSVKTKSSTANQSQKNTTQCHVGRSSLLKQIDELFTRQQAGNSNSVRIKMSEIIKSTKVSRNTIKKAIDSPSSGYTRDPNGFVERIY